MAFFPRLAAFLAVVLLSTVSHGQAPATPADAVAPDTAPTIEIDTGAVEGISVKGEGESSAEPNEAEPPGDDVAGPVKEALSDAVPDTGVESVDSAADTLSGSVGDMIDGSVRTLPTLVIAMIVLVATWLIVTLVTKLARRVFIKARLRESLRDLFLLMIRIGVWFLGFMLAAGILFPTFGFGQVVATAGLASIAIGFAFQDIFENFFAGVLILWNFPFENGDYIECEGIEGKVEDVQIRMTMVRTTAGELVLIPNSKIYKNIVRILTNKPIRRIELMVGIAYGEDIGEGREVISAAVESCPSVNKSQPIQVFAQAFGASSIDFEVAWWTKPTPLDQRASRDEVVEAIKKGLDDAGIEIPYPYRTLTFSKNEPDIIEAIRGQATAEDGDED